MPGRIPSPFNGGPPDDIEARVAQIEAWRDKIEEDDRRTRDEFRLELSEFRGILIRCDAALTVLSARAQAWERDVEREHRFVDEELKRIRSDHEQLARRLSRPDDDAQDSGQWTADHAIKAAEQLDAVKQRVSHAALEEARREAKIIAAKEIEGEVAEERRKRHEERARKDSEFAKSVEAQKQEDARVKRNKILDAVIKSIGVVLLMVATAVTARACGTPNAPQPVLKGP